MRNAPEGKRWKFDVSITLLIYWLLKVMKANVWVFCLLLCVCFVVWNSERLSLGRNVWLRERPCEYSYPNFLLCIVRWILALWVLPSEFLVVCSKMTSRGVCYGGIVLETLIPVLTSWGGTWQAEWERDLEISLSGWRDRHAHCMIHWGH